jgi:hypothetical protein
MAEDRGTTRRALRRFALGSGPLKRPSDRFQVLARVLVLLTVLTALPVALTVATASYSSGLGVAAAEAADRHQVPARLLEDATLANAPGSDSSEVMVATVGWTDPAGTEREDVVRVPPDARAGSTATIWIGPDGDRTRPPTTSGDVAATAIGLALLTFLAMGSAAAGAYAWLRAVLDRGRLRRWAEEWAVVEPVWTHTA